MRVLGGQAPLVADPEARHSEREYRVEWEAELLEVKRVDEYLAQREWFRQTNCQGEFWLGQHAPLRGGSSPRWSWRCAPMQQRAR